MITTHMKSYDRLMEKNVGKSKYCELCLNHGLNTLLTVNHQTNCRFISCKCDKCSHFVVINEDNQIILKKLNSMVKSVNNTNDVSKNKSKRNCEKSSQTDFPPRDAIEAVKTFAEQLANTDISETNLSTCVLFALLKSNEFSIEETKRKLLEARTAITESLVLPLKRTNHLTDTSSDKRSDDSLHLIPRSDSNEPFVPQKRLCSNSNRFTAKKSFNKLITLSTNEINSTKFNKTQVINVSGLRNPSLIKSSDISVQTNEQTIEKPLSNSPTIMASNKLSSPKSIASKPKSIAAKPKSIAAKPVVYTPNQSNRSYDSISLLKSPNNLRKADTIIQTNNTIGLNQQTYSKSNPNATTTYLVPIMPLMNFPSGMSQTYIQLPIPIQPQIAVTNSSAQVSASSTSVSIGSVGCLGSLNTTKTASNKIIRVSPSKLNLNSSSTADECALKGIKINSITKIPTNTVTTVSSASTTSAPTVKRPQIRTYSREQNKTYKSNANKTYESNANTTNKLCAKIITSEAALAALSAISSLSPTIDTIETSLPKIDNKCAKEEVEYILPDENSMSDDDLDKDYVINTCDKSLNSKVIQNTELSSNETMPLTPNSTTFLTPVNNSSNTSQNFAQRSLKVQGVANRAFNQSPVPQVIPNTTTKDVRYRATNINFLQQKTDKNIVQITID